jgi:elongation factor 2
MCKSANKHNKFIMTSEPLDENLVIKLEDGLIKSSPNDKNLYQSLINDYSWDQVDAKKIWCFGPENNGPNVIVDQTSQVQYLHETKELIENAFQWSSSEGVLCGENMRGIRFNILDATLHADVVHRGGGQIIPTAQRLFHAAQLSSQPRYQEPVYLVIVNCPNDVKNKIHGCFSVRKGIIFEEEEVSGTPQVNFKGYLPVSESFGFMEFLRSQTSGKAFAQTSFDHWELIKSDPLEKSSRAYEITLENRKRKGMKIEIPNINDYIDKA